MGLEAKKLNGLKKSLDRSRRTVFRATFFFFGSVAAVSVDVAAVSVDSVAAAVIVVDIGGSDATRDGRPERTVSVDCGAAAVTIIGGSFVATPAGRSERAVSADFGAAAVTVIGGGFDAAPDSERAVSLDFAATVAEVGGFDATRDGGTGGALKSCTILAGEGW